MNTLLTGYLKQFETEGLEAADMLINMDEHEDLFGNIVVGMSLARLSLIEQMTIVLLRFGFTANEIAKFRGSSVEAVYNMQRRIKVKIKTYEEAT